MAARIMVVDDEWMNREYLESYLQFLEYEVALAHNGEVALTLAEEKPPDIALVDVRLPDMNGYDVCKHLKQLDSPQVIKVILMSGLPLDKQLAEEVGVDDFIDRGDLTTMLTDRIERLLND